MATQQLAQFNTLSLIAGADLSARQWRFVKANSSGKVVSCDSTGEQAIGVNCGNPDAADKACPVQVGGIAKVDAGAAITAGDKVMTDTVGRAIAHTGTNNVLGVALETASNAGERISVLIGSMASDGTPGGGLETVSAPGAIAPGIYETHLEVDGTDAFTMGDGAYVGQRKRVTCITAANTPLGTVTLNGAQAAFGSEPTAWVFTTVGQWVEWEWTATGWKVVGLGQVGVESLATTETANPLCLVHLINLTGANDYIQGAGLIAGQESIWIVTAGANASTISGLFYTTAGAATGVDLQVNAASDMAVLAWAGSRWVGKNLVSTTVA
jgi:hypothetical protein